MGAMLLGRGSAFLVLPPLQPTSAARTMKKTSAGCGKWKGGLSKSMCGRFSSSWAARADLIPARSTGRSLSRQLELCPGHTTTPCMHAQISALISGDRLQQLSRLQALIGTGNGRSCRVDVLVSRTDEQSNEARKDNKTR